MIDEKSKKLLEYKFSRSDGDAVEVPRVVNIIGAGAFHNCKGIKEIKMGFDVKSIEKGAFENHPSLEKVKICCDVSERAFCDCRFLETVEIWWNIAFIGKDAFKNCVNLKEIGPLDKIHSAEKGAFDGCIALERENPELWKALQELPTKAELDAKTSSLLEYIKDAGGAENMKYIMDSPRLCIYLDTLENNAEYCRMWHETYDDIITEIYSLPDGDVSYTLLLNPKERKAFQEDYGYPLAAIGWKCSESITTKTRFVVLDPHYIYDFEGYIRRIKYANSSYNYGKSKIDKALEAISEGRDIVFITIDNLKNLLGKI